MDFAIQIDSMTGVAEMSFDRAENGNLLNNIYLSLTVRRGSFFENLEFGSRLYLLQRAKNTPRTEAMAIEYCKEALAWLIDAGRVKKFDYCTQRDRVQDLHRLKILIEATKADGSVVSFSTFVEVV